MSTVYLLTYDTALAELVTAELRAIGQPPPTVCGGDAAIPSDAAVLLVDLDTVPTPPQVTAPTVALVRKEELLAPEVRARCAAVLHRPFPIATFRDTVTALLTPPAPEPPRAERRRLTARRSEKADAPAGLRFDAATGALLVGDSRIPLTKGEATVLSLLLRANGRPVSRTALLEALSAESRSNLPDVHVCAIRKKLRTYGKEHLLRTVRGVGYSFTEG